MVIGSATPRDEVSRKLGDSVPERTLCEGHYEVRFAHSTDELEAVQRLRFEVFNLELGEGFDESFVSGRDADEFDSICHHLIVTDLRTGAIVGCYRIQTARMAAINRGFYSATLFDLSTLPLNVVHRSAEIGRACVARSHRSTAVLFLLWKGLALYAGHNQIRYFFGCSSLTSQDPGEGNAVLRFLEEAGRMHPDWRIQPRPENRCPIDPRVAAAPGVPSLFRTYLRFGAKVCGPPAIDRDFRTIDYFVVLDLDSMPSRTRRMFFG